MKLQKTFFILSFLMSSLLTLSAYSQNESPLKFSGNIALDSIDRYNSAPASQKQKYLDEARIDVMVFNSIRYQNITVPAEEVRVREQITLDYYRQECGDNPNNTQACSKAKTLGANYNRKYSTNYSSNGIIIYPDIDFNKGTYSQNYRIFDIQKLIDAEKPTTKDESPSASDFTCVWDPEIERKIIYGPGCNGPGSKICRGEIICTPKGGGEAKNAVAVCGPQYCNDAGAQKCAAQNGYNTTEVTK